MTKVEMMVPKTAKRDMVQKFEKNAVVSSEYAASNIIGGSRRKKKSSGSKLRKLSSSVEGYTALASPPTTIPTKMAAADSGK